MLPRGFRFQPQVVLSPQGLLGEASDLVEQGQIIPSVRFMNFDLQNLETCKWLFEGAKSKCSSSHSNQNWDIAISKFICSKCTLKDTRTDLHLCLKSGGDHFYKIKRTKAYMCQSQCLHLVGSCF